MEYIMTRLSITIQTKIPIQNDGEAWWYSLRCRRGSRAWKLCGGPTEGWWKTLHATYLGSQISMKVDGVVWSFFFGRGEIDCRSDGLCFFLCLRVFVLNVFFWLAMRRVRVKDGFDD